MRNARPRAPVDRCFMRPYSLSHLSDANLLRGLRALVARDRATIAELIAHIAEVDARRLYVPAGYASMHAYCVGELGLSEDAAFKRITAARVARQFPVLFGLLEQGRLHLTAVRALAPHLAPAIAEELFEAAAGLSKTELDRMLARRFACAGIPSLVLPMLSPSGQTAASQDVASPPEPATQLAPGRVEILPAPPEPAALADRVLLRVAVERSTYDNLRYAQELLSHSVPSGDVAKVLDRALKALIVQLEKRKFAATTRPRLRSRQKATAGTRSVPAHVRRVVWERDQGRCTFVGESGHRCGSRKLLEFDHVDPVARGGRATVERMRLRCRAHNQYEAERAFGAEFMSGKRNGGRRAADEATALRLRAQSERTAADEQARDVMAGLRSLGFHVGEARRGTESSQALEGATLEECLRAAIRFLRPPRNSPARSATSANGPGARADRGERGATLERAAQSAISAPASP